MLNGSIQTIEKHLWKEIVKLPIVRWTIRMPLGFQLSLFSVIGGWPVESGGTGNLNRFIYLRMTTVHLTRRGVSRPWPVGGLFRFGSRSRVVISESEADAYFLCESLKWGLKTKKRFFRFFSRKKLWSHCCVKKTI